MSGLIFWRPNDEVEIFYLEDREESKSGSSQLLWYHGLTDEVLASLHPGIEAPRRVIIREVPGERLGSGWVSGWGWTDPCRDLLPSNEVVAVQHVCELLHSVCEISFEGFRAFRPISKGVPPGDAPTQAEEELAKLVTQQFDDGFVFLLREVIDGLLQCCESFKLQSTKNDTTKLGGKDYVLQIFPTSDIQGASGLRIVECHQVVAVSAGHIVPPD